MRGYPATGQKEEIVLSHSLRPEDNEFTVLPGRIFFIRENDIYMLDLDSKEFVRVTTTGNVRVLGNAKAGTLAYATEDRYVYLYDPVREVTKEIMRTSKPSDRVEVQYPRRKQYLYFLSGDNLVQVVTDII